MILLLRFLTIIIVGGLSYLSYFYKSEGMAIVLLGGFISGVLFMSAYMLKIKNELSAYKRELEKKLVNADEKSSQVGVLKAKIEVLEKALKNALDNK